jgi:hypothetical protein
VGGWLLDPFMLRREDGVLVGRLNRRARYVLGLTWMQKAWPSVLQKWVLTGWIGER